MLRWPGSVVVGLSAIGLAGCGLYVPEKDPFRADIPGPPGSGSPQGNYEVGIVNHIECEISQGLSKVQSFRNMGWFFESWGFTITISITAEDQTGLAPGISFLNPLPRTQSFAFSLGGSASVNSLRTETFEFTLRNRDIVKHDCNGPPPSGVLIDGDLKLREFIFDTALVASSNNLLSAAQDYGRPQYNTWTEELTFVSSYGGSATPTWKLTNLTSGTSSNLLVAQRTNTNDVVITFGPLLRPDKVDSSLSLTATAMAQHLTRVQAAAIAVSATNQTH